MTGGNRLLCKIVNGRAEIDGLVIPIAGKGRMKKGPGIFFVRPHDVEIILPVESHKRDAIIQNVSFAGPLLNLEPLHIRWAQTLNAQIHRERWAQLGLQAGDGVVIRLRNVKVFGG